MMKVDRQTFIDHVNGVFLTRNKEGVVTHLGDSRKAEQCIEYMDDGGTVTLTVKGNNYSTISFVDGEGYVEENI